MAGGWYARGRMAVVMTAALACVPLVGSPAHAAGSAYGIWAVTGSTPNWTGTLRVPANGFPGADLRITSNTPETPTGATTFLGPATPFGVVFGSSQNRPHLNVPAGPGGSPSTTTFTFAAPTPAGGWGFALGDIDADQVSIAATDPSGNPVPTAALGLQGTFNYCATTPKPVSCLGPGPFTDVPTWTPATATLRGTGTDTFGASGWFRPTTPLATLTLTFSVVTGIPVYQMWVAALTAQIAGTVAALDEPAPPLTTLRLVHPDGRAVVDATGAPILSTTAADGSYTFGEIAAGTYQVVVEPPDGYVAVGPASRAADVSNVDVTDIGFTIARTPVPTATSTSAASALPITGWPVTGMITVALALIAAGAALQRTRR